MKRTALALLVLAATAAPASAGGGCYIEGPSDQVAMTIIKIHHVCFTPGAALVAPGATLEFVNASGIDHDISGPGIEWAKLPDGASHTVTFDRPGLYPYACMLHPGMSGVVVVGALPSAPAATAAAIAPVASASDTGGTSVVPFVAGGAAALLLVGALVGFGRRTRGVPLPAR